MSELILDRLLSEFCFKFDFHFLLSFNQEKEVTKSILASDCVGTFLRN